MFVRSVASDVTMKSWQAWQIRCRSQFLRHVYIANGLKRMALASISLCFEHFSTALFWLCSSNQCIFESMIFIYIFLILIIPISIYSYCFLYVTLKISVVYLIYVHFCFIFVLAFALANRSETKQNHSSTHWFRVSELHFIFFFFFLVRVLNFSVLRLSFRAREGIFVRIAKLHAHTSKSHAKM